MKTITIKVMEAGVKLDGVKKVWQQIRKSKGEDMRAGFEYLTAYYLDAKNRFMKEQTWGPGTTNENVVYPGTIMRIGLLIGATNIIFAHNHPSGDLSPSSADISMTRKMQEAARLVGLTVVDHIVYSENNYFSFIQEGVAI